MLVQLDNTRYKFVFNPYCEACGYEEHRNQNFTLKSNAQAIEFAENIQMKQSHSDNTTKGSNSGPSKPVLRDRFQFLIASTVSPVLT
ncbi:hypothetical protein H4Q26_009416 [Puccinia striiformis f. sp. tritici PST-130]|nr:hypothetical protein H4Q26_009416 [Puccinia striiformis f. sp. tritici PST-130]